MRVLLYSLTIQLLQFSKPSSPFSRKCVPEYFLLVSDCRRFEFFNVFCTADPLLFVYHESDVQSVAYLKNVARGLNSTPIL